jgi:hypothetical protein
MEIAANTGMATLAPVVADAGAVVEPEVQDPVIDDGIDGAAIDAGSSDAGSMDDGSSDSGQTDEQKAAAEAEKTDGRVAPDAVKKGLAALKTENPAAAKALRESFFANQQYKQAFPTPQEASDAKAFLESLGENPQEAIASFQKASETLEGIDTAIESGDPEFISHIFENNPEGAAKLVGPALSQLFKLNPDEYSKVTAPILTATLNKPNGIVAHLQALHTALKAGKSDEAMKYLSGAASQIDELNDFVAQSRQADPLQPQREQLKNKERELQQTAEKQFDSSLSAAITPQRDSIIEKSLKPFVDGKNVDAARLTTIKRNVLQSLQEHYNNDKTLTQQYSTLRSTKDAAKITKFTVDKLNVLLPGIVDTVAKHFGLSASAAQPNPRQNRTVIRGDHKGTNNDKAAEGTRDNPIRREPSPKDIDTKRTNTFMRVSQKLAVGKDGKWYRWDGK